VRRHGRLFWRVYAHGVLLLVLVAVAAGISGLALRRTAPWHGFPERVAAYLAAHTSDLQRPELIARDLDHERDVLGVEMSVWRPDGTLVATNVQPPVARLQGEDLEKLSAGIVHAAKLRVTAVPVRQGGQVVAYVSIGGLPLAALLSRVALLLALVLMALAVGSYPLARAITSPIEKLIAVTQRLGSGDLSVRTGLKRNDEVGKLASAFDEMAGRLELLVRGEKELLANVSHELRTPLSRIRVALELASEGDGARAQGYIKEIATDLGELERLIEDVLTVARLDLMGGHDGAPPLRRAKVGARVVLDRSIEHFRAAYPDRALTVQLAEGLPEIDADELMLRRAVDNLLDNARKYSEPDKPVLLSASAHDGLTVEIVDQGIGIEAQDLSNLFRPFFRTERSRSRGTGGVGLGLALAKKIVEGHGGRIAVESVVGKGTTVRVRIPSVA
jgi:signal transduction histidine kinase